MSAVQQFVFGYGSLICPFSRAITAPTLTGKTVTPVMVRHVERTWAKKIDRAMTAMGVRFVDHAKCAGVLLPVNASELKQFDRRERGYDRVPLYLGDIEPYVNDRAATHLHSSHRPSNIHRAFRNAKQDHANHSSVKIWMYLQQDLEPPSKDAPIVQSYVDTILRGCLTISDDFAEHFITDTKGWTPSEIEVLLDSTDDDTDDGDTSTMEDDNTDNDNTDASSLSSEGENVSWVDDRHDPIYRRGDQQYMLKHGQYLDSLLKRHRGEFQYRTRRASAMANQDSL